MNWKRFSEFYANVFVLSMALSFTTIFIGTFFMPNKVSLIALNIFHEASLEFVGIIIGLICLALNWNKFIKVN